MTKYQPSQIEPKWQKYWQDQGTYNFEYDSKKPYFYNLVELPYPSGDLHVGHWFAFVTPDVIARFKRMTGHNVFFTNGYDAFGLPAENAAIKRGIHPKDWTYANMESMTKQFQTLGTMIDWRFSLATCDPEYYKWNQWIFLKLMEKDLAYLGKALSNWCPSCQTVLANENVDGGKCWRCGSEVIQKEVSQWFYKITDYADKLIWPESPKVDWPMSVRVGQNNWIGKSEGVEITFPVQDSEHKITVFTVYPETIFGVTYLVLAPESPLVSELTTPECEAAVTKYVQEASKKSELERKSLEKQKTGCFTGRYVINPVNDQKVPVWVSDYVIAGYGTGAVMGVPGSDERDFSFAEKYDLPVIRVIGKSADDLSEVLSIEEALEEGILVNSSQFDGLKSPKEARPRIIEWLISQGFAKSKIQYHLHDWSISRQRYWGTPVPVIHCPTDGLVPVPEKDLPVELPYDVDFAPKGKPPLASDEKWLKVDCPKCGGPAERDAETLDTFMDSSWYYYRYLDPHYSDGPFNPEKVKQLMPVSIYFGGAEHTLGHTLYARFMTKFFKDLGLVDLDEFANKRVQHGTVLGPDGNKMSKSKGNVINPDDVVKEYGSDTVRLYLCFMMPYEAVGPWSQSAIAGAYRFITRIWDLSDNLSDSLPDKASLIKLNQTIDKVTGDLKSIKTNTAIAALMEWLNFLAKKPKLTKIEYKNLLLLLAPFAPHLTEQLWQDHFDKQSIHLQAWPAVDQAYLRDEEVTIPISINGKVRDSILVSSQKTGDQEAIEQLALERPKIQAYLKGQKPLKVIYVSGKILNLVIN